MPQVPQTIWVVVDHDGKVIHQSSDEQHLEIMRAYTCTAQEAGDDWILLEFKLNKVVECGNSKDSS